MKLRPGDTIRVTKADGKARGGEEDFTLYGGALFVEWNGRGFLGCMSPETGSRVYWPLKAMRFFQKVAQKNPATRTNIDCMFEQLVAEGALS